MAHNGEIWLGKIFTISMDCRIHEFPKIRLLQIILR